jgi:anaerobic magnesium-protoporphyrin IX monomethyl ester cyclase
MKVVFVVIGAEQIGISQLSSILKNEGHEVALAFSPAMFDDRTNLDIPYLAKMFDDYGDVMKTIEREKPDVLAFSCLTATYQWLLRVARDGKVMFPNVKTVFGGVHISAVPDRAIARPEVDYVVVGEGDFCFPKILEAIEKGDRITPIPNTRFKAIDGSVIRGVQQGFVQDLDSLPFPDKAIWEDHIRIKDLYLIISSRGCPYTCSFCFNNFYVRLPEEKKGRYVRQRSVDHVMQELIWAKKRYDIQVVDFQDDIFTLSKPWVKEFCERYKKEIDRPFQILVHPKYFDDDMARWLKEAGCDWVQMGIQTMDEKFKHETLRRYEDSNHIVNGLNSMNHYGLKPKVDHMFGLPGEPIESQATALKVYAESTPRRISTFWTTFLPGTDMMKQALASGRITQEYAESLYEGEGFYFFRNEDNITDKHLVKTYQQYELIYKILPALPKSWRPKLQLKHVAWVTKTQARIISVIMDLYGGFRNQNPEYPAYIRHYWFHTTSFIRKRLGFGPGRATKPAKGTSEQAPKFVQVKQVSLEEMHKSVA